MVKKRLDVPAAAQTVDLPCHISVSTLENESGVQRRARDAPRTMADEDIAGHYEVLEELGRESSRFCNSGCLFTLVAPG